jgi:uncharacterized protein YjdB
LGVNDPATIHLLIVYTQVAANSSYASQRGGINNIIARMVELGNICMTNSQVGINLVVAHSEQVNYTATDMDSSLSRLQNPSDGYMDNVHVLRKQYNADLVQLITTDAGGGLGYIINPTTNGSVNYGFSVVNVTALTPDYPCSVHEFGHNMGLGHGAQHIDVWSEGIFDYSYGYRWTGTTTVNMGGTNTNLKGSVMTYWTGIYYSDGMPCYNVPYFSNPDVNFEGATGTNSFIGPHNKQANAARSLREVKHTVAYYSDKLANFPDAPTNIVVSNPTDNGATFTWDACANATGYRVCNSAGNYFSTTNTTYTVSHPTWFPSQCTNYDFFITAVNECEDATNSATFTFKTKCTTDPTVTTSAATNITNNSATLNKTVTANGATVTAQGFQYRKSSESSWQTSTTGNVTGLTANTQYKFYAYATTASGTINGNVLDFTTATTGTVSVTGVTISPATVSFTSIGATQQLTATVTPANATNKTVTWSSSNTSVATVNQTSGLVTATGCGTATITATTQDGNKTATCAITINIPVTGVTISPTTVSLTSIGATQQLTATVAPATACNKTVTWSSSNTSVATVSTSGLVTATGCGTATITATTQDGNKTATCPITVNIPVTSVTISPSTVSLTAINATQQLTATVAPATACNKTVTWSSSNTSVATVNTSGLVTATGCGTATITATTQDGNKTRP